LRYLVFMPPDSVRDRLQDTAHLKRHSPCAWAYIQWGEQRGYQNNPTMRARDTWYLLVPKESRIPILRASADRPAFYFSDFQILHDQTFYSIYCENRNMEKILAGILNASFSNYLVREVSSGASSMLGQGALWSAVYETKDIRLPNPAAFTDEQRERLLNAFEQMAGREVKSIFEELGLPKPNRDYSNIRLEEVSLKRVLPDRRALDEVVFEVLGLSESEQLAVYRGVVELVRNRLVKAQNVG